MRVTFRTLAWLGVVGVLCGLVACSRQKPAKGPAKPAAVAPATKVAPGTGSQPAETSSARTGKVDVIRTLESQSGRYRPPRPGESTLEEKDALRAKQLEFARQAIAKGLTHNGQERVAAEIELVKAESQARAGDAAVRSAHEAWVKSRVAYEAVCATVIAGHADLSRQAAELRAGVDRNIAAMEKGQAMDTNAMAQTLQRMDEVIRSLGDLERKALYDQRQVEVTQAHEALTSAHEAYQKALVANGIYKVKMGKRTAVLSEHTNLVARQRELSVEN